MKRYDGDIRSSMVSKIPSDRGRGYFLPAPG